MSTLSSAITACCTGIEHTREAMTANFLFTPEFIGFQGHFPGRPILPALVQLLCAQHLVQTARPAARTTGLRRAKFVRMIEPDEMLNVSCTLQEKNGMLLAATRITVADEPAATFTLELAG